jgi:hypothetical protein
VQRREEPTAIGQYSDAEPLRFGPRDAAPITYAAYPGEEPIVDGGRRIEGWTETTVDGVDVWRTKVQAVEEGEWYFRSLFVDGERCQRARLPTDGWLTVRDPEPVPEDHARAELLNVTGKHGHDIGAPKSSIGDWHNPGDVDALIPNKWVQERSPLDTVDPESDRVRLSLYPKFVLEGGERLAFEGVREALSDPGEWYLDRESGELLYVPREGERPETTTVVAPRVKQLLRLEGEANAPVEHLRFEGVTFRHADWTHPGRLDNGVRIPPDDKDPHGSPRAGRGNRYRGAATSTQGQVGVPGTIDMRDAKHTAMVECTIEHVGFYGIGFRAGCRGNRIDRCTLRDLGAGGITFVGPKVVHPRERWVRDNHVTDCEITAGGRVFPAGVGVLVRHARDTTISHNEIHDLYYSGISVGWTWGFAESVERDNTVVGNHIHDIGQGRLSDMGGVYTLGVQPGTRIAKNLIHGIERYNYGGKGIYPDEGSSNIVIEKNVVFDVDCALGQHYGRENAVRNNVFVGGRDGCIGLSNPETGGQGFEPMTVERNVLVAEDGPLYARGYANDWESGTAIADCNLCWAPEEQISDTLDAENELEAWRDRGYDRHSSFADPGFVSTENHDYGLPVDSSATDLGIECGDLEYVGPRPCNNTQ